MLINRYQITECIDRLGFNLTLLFGEDSSLRRIDIFIKKDFVMTGGNFELKKVKNDKPNPRPK